MEFNKRIDQLTDKFKSSFNDLSSSQLNWKPTPDVWSIAQNIGHLITINESYYPTFEALHKGEYKVDFISKIGFLVNWFGDIILKSVHPDRKKKIKTFPMWEPSQSNIPEDILESFVIHQRELKRQIENLEQFNLDDTIIASPANKHIVYKLSKAIEVILTHELRHYNQAMEVYALLPEEL